MTSKSGNQVQQHTATTNPLSSGILQRQCATCGQHTIAGEECEECQKNHSESSSHRSLQTPFPPAPPPEENLPTLQGTGLKHDFTQIPIQTKLTVGEPGDKYEQEANRMAELVTQGDVIPPVQRQQLQQEDEDKTLQAKEQSGQTPELTSGLSTQLETINGGEPLPAATRAFVEPRFGYDFTQVRVHTDSPATDAAQQLKAQAFTHKHHIFFGAGKYNPESTEGKRLLAHELTHVVQQTADLSGETAIQRQEENPETAVTQALIVEDEAADLQPGQMKKSIFLAELRVGVCEAANAAIAQTGQTTNGCPYLDYWFDYYSNKDSQHIERAIHRYIPASSQITTARDYIPLIAERVSRGVEEWQQSGNSTQILANLPLNMSENSLLDSLGGLLSGAVNVLFKTQDGAARNVDNPQVIQAALGQGQPLEGSVKSRMESVFGRDFSDVQMHQDAAASNISAQYDARALTVGEHIAFAPGEYQPGTPIGDALIAHELAHVVQQDHAPATTQFKQMDNSSLEQDADQAAVGAVMSLWGGVKGAFSQFTRDALPRLKSGLRLQRCGGGGAERRPGVVYGRAPNTTTEVFAPGNVPGERPVAQVVNGGSEFRFDGDGDQIKELGARLQQTDSWSNGIAKTIHMDITQLSSSQSQGADFNLPNTQGASGPEFTIIEEVTDGRRPTIISLIVPISSQQVRFYPPDRNRPQSATDVTYRAELASHDPSPNPATAPATISQPKTFTFSRDTTPTRQVFRADPPVQIGGIWAVDITVGAYSDRFRLTFQKPNPAATQTIGGVSVLSEGAPLAGKKINLNVSGALNVRVVATDGVNLALDLNGDGRTDLEVFDRMIEPAEYDGGGSPVRNRNHDLLFVGSTLTSEENLDYSIRDGLIAAGSTTPRTEDMAAASNAQAVTGLEQQQTIGQPGITRPEEQGTLQGELDSVEALLSRARSQAHTDNMISDNMFSAWDLIERDFIVLVPQIQAHNVQPALQNQAATHAQAFYNALATETESAVRMQGAQGMYVRTNEFTGLGTVDPALGPSPGDRLVTEIHAGSWTEATARYRRLVNGLDRWIARKYRETYGSPDPNRPETNRANQITYLTTMRQRLYELKAQNAIRVSAVFHPEQQYLESGRITEIPLSLYYVREDDNWYLHDRTKPEEEWHTSAQTAQTGEIVPPHDLFQKLDEGAHFPRGTVHYQLRNGQGGQVQTTGPHPIREWLTWIGIGAAAIGLGLVTIATAGSAAAVIGAWALATSAAAGGTLATIDLIERAEHGTLTVETAIVDLAQIIAAIAGIGAIGSGRLVFSARMAAASSAPRTGARWALLLRWADQARVPLALTSAGSDFIQVAMLLPDIARQYDAIDDSPGDAESRRRAKLILLSQAAVTAGLTVLSLRGNFAEITAGRSLEIVSVNGEPVVLPKGASAPGREINRSRTQLGAGADEAAISAAEQAHLERIRTQIEGPGGQTLAEIETLALRQGRRTADSTITLGADGNLTQGGQPASMTMQQLIERVDMANNASRAHGITTEYVLEIRPGTAPDTSEVHIVGRERRAGTGARTAPLYQNVPVRAQAETAQIQRMLRLDPASTVAITSDGQIRLNQQMTLHPTRLSEIPEADLRDLMQLTRQVQAGGGNQAAVNALPPTDKRRLTALRGRYNLRFEYQRQEADTLLQALGIDNHPIFQNMTEADRSRLHQALVGDPGPSTKLRPIPDTTPPARTPGQPPDLQAQAANWALSRIPVDGTVSEFADLYQFYIAQFKRLRQARIARRDAMIEQRLAERRHADPSLDSDPQALARERDRISNLVFREPGMGSDDIISGDILRELGEPGNVRVAGEQARTNISEVYEQQTQAWQGRIGSSHLRLNPGETVRSLSSEEVVRRVQNLANEITFGSQSSATYHTRKHFPEIETATPEITRGANGQVLEADSYLRSARETIRQPNQSLTEIGNAGATYVYGGSRSYIFRRELANGRTMGAIVAVTDNGEVFLLTYFSGAGGG